MGRWREDVIENGRPRRIYRSDVLGSKVDYPTKRSVQRELEKRLAVVNDPRYRARSTATFEEFAFRWESSVVTQFKPSTQATLRSHLRKHLVPYFAQRQLRDIGPEYSRFFGQPTKRDIRTLRSRGALPLESVSNQ